MSENKELEEVTIKSTLLTRIIAFTLIAVVTGGLMLGVFLILTN